MSENYNLPPGTSSGPSKSGWQPPTSDELHAQLPQYEILEVLGVGGMAAVYKGFQTSLERYVAIKILPPSFDEDLQYAQRFKQEAKTMARLSHVGIVGVHDCGQTTSGLLYIVMEFVEGTDIHRMIQRQGHLSAEEAMAITLHVCDALSYAHENGVVHRDIKPGNIMVDTQGRVKVADFGLAKSAVLNIDESNSKIAMGTPGYVAPEALMMGVEVDQRADVFAVGAMLYEMLTGKTPTAQFELASVMVPGLDARYDQVIKRATQYDRDARYRTAQELKNDLIKIHTVPMSQSGLRRAGQAVFVPPRRSPAVAPVKPKGGFPVTLVGVGLVAVLAIGLFLWKPWAEKKSEEEAAPTMAKSGLPSPESTPSESPAPASPSQEKPVPAPVAPSVAAASKTETPPPTPGPEIPPVAPVPAKPAPEPPQPPQSELDVRLAKLDQQFHAAASRDVEPGFQAGVAALDRGYVGALERALVTVSQAGKLEEALAIRAEKQRIEKGQGAPPETEDGDTPKSLRDLRKTYRTSRSRLENDCSKSLQPLYDKYDQALAYYESEQTKAGKFEDATRVKNLRVRLDQIRRASPAVSLNGLGNQAMFSNSLGMKFVAVPIIGGPTHGQRVLFSVWDTRVQDYEVFVKETKHEWRKTEFPQGPTHPAVMVDWDATHAFCQWLTERERKAGVISAQQGYRLPNDHEWSCAVGLGEREDAAKHPNEKSAGINNEFPWGTEWPPSAPAGNYAGEELRPALAAGKHANLKEVITGYNDGFVETSPVGSFAANQFGLFDMGGNVWQWCEDWFEKEQRNKTLRGASWDNPDRLRLLLSFRRYSPVQVVSPNYGFRCVLAGAMPSASVPTQGTAAEANNTPVDALLADDKPWTGDIALPPKVYRFQKQIVLGKFDPPDNTNTVAANVTSSPGTSMESVDLFLKKGSWKADGTLFKEASIAIQYGGEMQARDSLFDACVIKKVGAAGLKYFSVKWTFENCVFSKTFISPWQVYHVGAQATHCTFLDVAFSRITFREDAGREALDPWVTLRNCRFVGCKVPESVVLATKDCVFEDCHFGDPEKDMVITTPITVRIYTPQIGSDPPAGPNRKIEMLNSRQLSEPAGATLRYRKVGGSLAFE